MRIGFIGLGNMGAPMAQNIAKAGHKVFGFDLNEVNVEGVVVENEIKKAVTGKDVVITMLPDGKILKSVYQEILPLITQNSILIDCSTVDVETAKLVAFNAKGKNLRALDAPVSGGVVGAKNGTLTFMVGGEETAFKSALPLFDIMGQKAILCGENGLGQVAKMCNNMILGISMIGVCEAFLLADKLNFDRQKMFDVVSTSSGYCWSLNAYCPAAGVGPPSPADNHYIPGFSTELMLKDLTLAKKAAQNVSSQIPLGAHAQKIFKSFAESNGKGKDFSAIINYLGDSS